MDSSLSSLQHDLAKLARAVCSMQFVPCLPVLVCLGMRACMRLTRTHTIPHAHHSHAITQVEEAALARASLVKAQDKMAASVKKLQVSEPLRVGYACVLHAVSIDCVWLCRNTRARAHTYMHECTCASSRAKWLDAGGARQCNSSDPTKGRRASS